MLWLGKPLAGYRLRNGTRKVSGRKSSNPYALFDGADCVAGILANQFDIDVLGAHKTYVQLGTVMTAPAHRHKGLSQFLMGEILRDWKNRCDGIYLYANDSVVDFYPKFGFVEGQEYQYSLTVSVRKGNVRKLNIGDQADKSILLEKIRQGNPYTAVKMCDGVSCVMFHCLMFLGENLYFLPKYDAVAVMEQKGDFLLCYDIFCKGNHPIEEILSQLVNDRCGRVSLGFTPKDTGNYDALPLREEDTHLFVLQDKENVFRNNKLMFPLLGHT